MTFDFIGIQLESHARHLSCKRFFQLRTPFACKKIRVVDSPASHGLPVYLSGKVPNVASNIVRNREKVEIRDPPPLPCGHLPQIRLKFVSRIWGRQGGVITSNTLAVYT